MIILFNIHSYKPLKVDKKHFRLLYKQFCVPTTFFSYCGCALYDGSSVNLRHNYNDIA